MTQFPLEYGLHWGTTISPLGFCCRVKLSTKRQSKSVASVLPASQIPLASEAGTSTEVTVRVKPVLTAGTVSLREWALGSVQGTVPEGQLRTALFETGAGLALKVTGVTTVLGQVAGELELEALPCGATMVKESATLSGSLLVTMEKFALEREMAQLVM